MLLSMHMMIRKKTELTKYWLAQKRAILSNKLPRECIDKYYPQGVYQQIPTLGKVLANITF